MSLSRIFIHGFTDVLFFLISIPTVFQATTLISQTRQAHFQIYTKINVDKFIMTYSQVRVNKFTEENPGSIVVYHLKLGKPHST